jgi:alkanesulfonate monooxygenase SsuD/methylene tetrahydromethanopterin reductase-like flavin-dependent oxidoreductase (luciferase family)
MFPKPVQHPHPPIHVGGESDAALARAARAGRGWHTFNRTPDQLAVPLGRLAELLDAQGRRREEVTVTVCPYLQPLDADIAERYAEAGVDAVAALLLPFGVDGVRSAFDALQPVFERAASL